MGHIVRLIKHRWFVFIAGIRLGVPLRQLIIHDLSKFFSPERSAYNRQHFGKADRPYEWAVAWVHHQNHNPHHWEYWISRSGRGELNGNPIEMPIRYVNEMVADWLAAGRAYNGAWPDMSDWTWLKENYRKIRLHDNTRIVLRVILRDLGAQNVFEETRDGMAE